MKKNLLKLAGFSLLTAALVAAPTPTFAAEKKGKPETPAAEKKAAPKGERGPFHGKLAAVDKQAKTITVGQRTFQITSETKIKKNGKPATLDDAVVGEPAGGYFIKGDDGKLVARSLNLGAKPEGEGKSAGKKKKQAE
jgi:hypothetical protein